MTTVPSAQTDLDSPAPGSAPAESDLPAYFDPAVPLPPPVQPLTPTPRLGKAALMALPAQTTEVEVPGVTIQKLRELMGGELGIVNHAAVQRVGDKVITDYRYYKERVLAYTMLNEDGSQMWDHPERDYIQVAKLPTRLIEAFYRAVDDMSAITKRAQDALGKDSPGTTGLATASNSPTSGAAPSENSSAG